MGQQAEKLELLTSEADKIFQFQDNFDRRQWEEQKTEKKQDRRDFLPSGTLPFA